MKKIIFSIVMITAFECSVPSYDYDASNIISRLQEFQSQVHMPSLMVHYQDSTFSSRNRCYKVMKDNRIYQINEKNSIILSEQEAARLILQIVQEYQYEKEKNPKKEKPKNPTQKHFYRTVYRG